MKQFEIIHEETTELVNMINNANQLLDILDDDKKLVYYPSAFLEIFIKFQNLVYTQFESYCLGQKSSSNFCPNRKHTFADLVELRHFSKSNGPFIDYDSTIESLSSYIFEDDPFDNLSQMAPISYTQLKNIRNYIAHESKTSKNKLISAKFINDEQDINIYLAKKNRHSSKINYDRIVDSIYNFSNYLIEG